MKFNFEKIVLKIGSSSLFDERGNFNFQRIGALAKELKKLNKEKIKTLLVTSGAIALGIKKLGHLKKGQNIVEKQALAAVGQNLLMNEYQKIFSKQKLVVAQILLTQDDFSARSSYLNARNTLNTLLELEVIPIINENDSVAVEEIKVGDNDTLSALVAGLINADLLLIATNTDGLCEFKGKFDKTGKVIHRVEEINQDIFKLCSGKSALGTGGMLTKIKAAQIASASGIPTKIFNSNLIGKINLKEIILNEKIGTFFCPKADKMEARKRWIAQGLKPKGKIIVDDGAFQILTKGGKSLLPVGIKQVEGTFEAGESVSIYNLLGKEFGRGLVNYSSEEINQIKGVKSSDIEKKIGYKYSDEVIHRDNLVIL